MAARKPKTQSVTDMRVLQQWRIQADENGMESYVCVGWEIQVQRGTDEWKKLDVENVVLSEPQVEETSNG